MTTRLLALLLILQASGLAWRWWPQYTVAPVPALPAAPVLPTPTEHTAEVSTLALLRGFEADWNAGRIDPFDSGSHGAPRKPRPRNLRPVQPREVREKEALADPVLSRSDWQNKRFNLRKEYAGFFIANRITPAQSTQVLDLLADLATGQRLAKVEAYEAGEPSLGPSLQQSVQQEIDHKIEAVLGSALTTALERYRTTLPIRRDFDTILADLRGMNAEPTAAAQNALFEVLVANKSAEGESHYDRDKIQRDAATVLTPAQIQIVDEHIKRRNPTPTE